ncbi:class I SAM-dependent methyltransferase [Arsenicicoccus piscis]|uniref:Methyltransferase n=1 Tax=Arsenicicoccus piscis TaxID=673954 RepID=A0ABQ6HRT6_9MICO|nr:class I SAM-dependent methyltransferase [Arsenicicoccus piscis]MCH8626455.1 class I SAM-dependent methyltransferase [Arsenicicoccus piscis]GMA21081.1 methyltransferase [Arsenicicoccus piscis]
MSADTDVEGTPVRGSRVTGGQVADADFESVYRADPDPFRVGTSAYEQRKQRIVLASLARERYTSVWDAASGTGHLARQLARRSTRLLATDAAPTAVRLTKQLLLETSGQPDHHGAESRTAVLRLPAQPDGMFDLVVLAEVLYYLPDADRQATLAAASEVAAPDAEVVVVHWRHHPHDAHVSGADATMEAVASLIAMGWRPSCQHQDTDFVTAHLVRGELAVPRPVTA